MIEESRINTSALTLIRANLRIKFAHQWLHKKHANDGESVRDPAIQQAVTVRFMASGHYEFTGISSSSDTITSRLFLNVGSNVTQDARVEAMLILPSHTSQPVSLQVSGKVVRIERSLSSEIPALAFTRLVIAPDPRRAPPQ